MARVVQEVAIMKTLDHPNIIKLFEAWNMFGWWNYWMMVMDVAPNVSMKPLDVDVWMNFCLDVDVGWFMLMWTLDVWMNIPFWDAASWKRLNGWTLLDAASRRNGSRIFKVHRLVDWLTQGEKGFVNQGNIWRWWLLVPLLQTCYHTDPMMLLNMLKLPKKWQNRSVNWDDLIYPLPVGIQHREAS